MRREGWTSSADEGLGSFRSLVLPGILIGGVVLGGVSEVEGGLVCSMLRSLEWVVTTVSSAVGIAKGVTNLLSG